eukprot:m.193554 g.193554  ORF g.193554 m.193554 type:complete len:137 (+) comp14881_c0_seq7:87-497(+)
MPPCSRAFTIKGVHVMEQASLWFKDRKATTRQKAIEKQDRRKQLLCELKKHDTVKALNTGNKSVFVHAKRDENDGRKKGGSRAFIQPNQTKKGIESLKSQKLIVRTDKRKGKGDGAAKKRSKNRHSAVSEANATNT